MVGPAEQALTEAEPFKALRAPFSASETNQLPASNKRPKLDYIGHAVVTDRLLAVDPSWTWEPMGRFDTGDPVITRRECVHTDKDGEVVATTIQAVLWIRLTVLDVTRPGVGIVDANKDELEKELISDALRNAAMRFGVALDLWKKEQPAVQAPAKRAAPKPVTSTLDANAAPVIDALTEKVRLLPEMQREVFASWKQQQGFVWPWTADDVKAMDTKLAELEVY